MGRSRTIYVENLPGDVREKEVEDLFCKYGNIVDIDLKIPPGSPGYAFVEFEDAHNAEDAIYGRDGFNFDGGRLRVELAHGGRGGSSSYDRNNSFNSGGGSVSRPTGHQVTNDPDLEAVTENIINVSLTQTESAEGEGSRTKLV